MSANDAEQEDHYEKSNGLDESDDEDVVDKSLARLCLAKICEIDTEHP